MSLGFKIAILTTARSDFGLLKTIVKLASSKFKVDLIVAGSHFLQSRGFTYNEIMEECTNYPEVNIVPFDLMSEDESELARIKTISQTQIIASKWFSNNSYDCLIFLGDRWELWGVTIPAFLHNIPLAHISGGEVTEGVIDDCIRHSHTKIASLHFVATQEFARNISLMGEEDWRISVVGECGLDHIYNPNITTLEGIQANFDIDLRNSTILVTFHPSTLELDTPVEQQISSLLQVLTNFSNHQIVFTAPGVEKGSEIVLSAIQQFVEDNTNAKLVNHFGSRNYLTVMRHSKVVIGNSSSGVVEAASFGVPAVNIGSRQKNRLAATSVQHTSYTPSEIEAAIKQALTDQYQSYAKTCQNPYDPYKDGKNSWRIVQAIETAIHKHPRGKLLTKKFDTDVNLSEWNNLLEGTK